MPGPRPKPTHLKLLAGNPGHKPLPENEPQPDGDLLEAPEYLSARAQLIWRRTLPLVPAGLLRKLDSSVFERWCIAKELYESSYAKVVESGQVIASGKRGAFQYNPFLITMNQAAKAMRAASDEMGFSPAARTRVQVKGKTKGKGKFSGLKALQL
jgi:P27 family predicted phage terminase small subunit